MHQALCTVRVTEPSKRRGGCYAGFATSIDRLWMPRHHGAAAPSGGDEDVTRAQRWALGVVLPAVLGSQGCDSHSADSKISPRELADALGSYQRFPGQFAGFAAPSACPLPASSDADVIPATECQRPPEATAPQFKALSRLSDGIRQLDQESTDSSSLRTVALWRLLWSDDSEAITKSVRDLEKAVRLQPSAAAWNDLSVAYLLRAQADDTPVDLLRAFDAATKALDLQPDNSSARDNRALAAKRIGLGAVAAQSENDHPLRNWTPIRQRLEAGGQVTAQDLAPAVTEGFSQQLRELAEQDLLGRWGSAVLQGDAAVADHWDGVLRTVGEVLFQASGERLLLAAHSQLAGSDEATRADLAVGYKELAAGLRSIEEVRFSSARQHLDRATAALARAASPMLGWAEHYLGVAEGYLGERPAALARQQAIVTSLTSTSGTKSLLGRALAVRGHLLDVAGKSGDAVADLEQARLLFAELDERENEAAARAVLVDILPDFGRIVDAERQLYLATASLPWTTSPLRRHNLLLRWAQLAIDRGLPHSSAMVLATMENPATRRTDPLAAFQAAQLKYRAESDPRTRIKLISTATQLLGQVENAGIRDPAEATVHLDRSRALLDEDPQAAALAATAALKGFDAMGLVWALDARLLRARAEAGIGDFTAAESDLHLAFQDLSRRRRTLASAAERALYMEQLNATGTVALQILLAKGADPASIWAALAVQRASTRELARRSAGDFPSRAKWSLHDLESQLGKDEAVLEFAVLPDRVLAWLIRSGGTRFEDIDLDAHHLTQDIAALQTALAEGHPAVATLAASLSKSLFGRFNELDRLSRLILIPDGPLFELPLYALSFPESNVPLASKIRLSVALRSTPIPSPPPAISRVPSAVFVADPLIRADLFPGLPPLSASREEVRISAGFYTQHAVMVAEEASFQRLREAILRRPSLLHIAAHTVHSPSRRWAAGFVLAPGPGQPEGVLWSDEILGLDLRGTRLVVLAGCRTATGSSGPLAVPLSLAQGFLQAGAQAVLSTLWDVDDRKTSEVLLRLHRDLALGTDAESALQRLISNDWAAADPQTRGVLASFQLLSQSPNKPEMATKWRQ